MNILYVNHYAGGPGWGMEYRPYYLAREWVKAGHHVTIVAASESHVRAKQPKTHGRFSSEAVDGIEYIWCDTPPYGGNGIGRVRNIITFLWRLRQWRQWLKHKPDVVIASSTYPADIAACRRLARRHAATLVWEVHDLWPLSPMELGGMSPRHPFIVWMQHAEDMACRDADVVVSMLPRADAHLRDHGMAEHKFVYVPNGIDPEEWAPEALVPLPAQHRQAVNEARQAGHLMVAYTGAHGVANALDTMLDAAKITVQMPVTWLLVGNGPEKGWLQKRVADEGIANVLVLDPVPKAAIPAFLAEMDVLYIGLQREPLFRFGISPNKLMDYMMAARPVICAIEAGNDPVGETGCGVTIEPENPQALADAVAKVLAMSPQQRADMGLRGRRHIELEQTFPVLAAKFLDAVRRYRKV